CFNLTCKDPVLRDLFNNDKFRKALSIAINREEINQIVYLGQATPRQASLIPQVPYYSSEWEKAWAEYDPKRANAMLDEIGLSKRDKDGYRLRPDGKRLSITIEFMEAIGFSADTCELIKKYWENLGIAVALKPEERSLYKARQSGNELEVYIEGMSSQIPFWAQDKWIIPSTSLDHWGIEFARWYVTGGKSGEEPPADIKRLFSLWDQAKLSLNETQRRTLVQEMVNLHIKNIWFIGTVGMAPTYAIAKNTLRNVPENIMDAALDTPRQAEPSQFFIRQK
ncbi:ABC transporter substrate-binding protein, partial [bacterium]|nr:ABC transporter substrate-binding protein [bacterium]